MAFTTPTQFFAGAASTTAANIDGSATAKIITSITIANTAASAGTFTISYGSTALASAVSIPANTTVVMDGIRIVTDGTTRLTGLASATTINFLVSGVI